MEKSNKLIAEFMGWDIQSPTTIPTNLHLSNLELDNGEVMELKFNTSWDWLIPVVQKIGDEYLNTPFDETYSHLTEQYENIWTLEDTYNAVIEFIKDQNTIKNN